MAYTTIDDPEAYFQVKTYTGNGSDDHAQTFDGTTDMQPDMVWIKSRSDTGYNHCLIDSVRGVTKVIRPNLLNAEATLSDALKSFDSDGFTLDDDGSNGEMNVNTQTYIAWCWKESADAGFDIVSYTGNGTARTIAHSLSAVPKFIFLRRRDASTNWSTYHVSTGNGHSDPLNEGEVPTDSTSFWNDTTPTSSVFTVGTISNTNNDGSAIIAYLFAEKQGFSKFGSYEGNGNANGPFVYLGFRPAFLIYKPIDANGNWEIHTSKTDPFNPMDTLLYANINNAESSPGGTTDRLDFLSNGFKILDSGGHINTSGNTYIYMAFAEAPFVNSNGVPCNAR